MTVRFRDVSVGEEIPSLSKVVQREEVKAYADASGDQNPLHQDDAFARSVGFPGIIAHGMFTLAHLTKALTDWLGDPSALLQLKVQIRAMAISPPVSTRSRMSAGGVDSERVGILPGLPPTRRRMRPGRFLGRACFAVCCMVLSRSGAGARASRPESRRRGRPIHEGARTFAVWRGPLPASSRAPILDAVAVHPLISAGS